MLSIPCPWCGPRDETEFRYGGQAGIAYPADPDALTDAEWAEYLFMRDNPKGALARALGATPPAAGAGSTLTRDTLTNEVLRLAAGARARIDG